MNRLATLCLISVLAASCSSEKFKPGDSEEDSVIDTTEDVVEDTTAEVLPDAPDAPECYEDADCDDGDSCTSDTCNSIGLCHYTEICECREDADCDDADRCTINECTESGSCRTTPFIELAIEVIESSDAPTIRRGTGQQLLQLRFSSLISLEIDEITWHIGADCSGDGVFSTSGDGYYEDTGGHCESAGFPLEGLYDDLENHGHVRNIEVRDLGTGATLQGPFAYPFFDLGITDDDGISIVFSDNISLGTESVLEVMLIADLTTASNMRANVNVNDIVFLGDPELCIDVETTVLEGLMRTNEG